MSVCDSVPARGWLWAWGDTNSFRCSTQQHTLHGKLVAQEGSLGANSFPGLIYQIPVGSLSYIKSYSVGEALRHHHIHNHFSFVSAPPSWNSLFQWNSASNRTEGLAHIRQALCCWATASAFVLLLFLDASSLSCPDWLCPHPVAEAGIELWILLPQFHK